MREVAAADVRAFRVRAQQLGRSSGTLADTAVLDAGVQGTGTDGARWALALRGLDPAGLPEDALATAWTLRGAPHVYRRSDLPAVAAAVRPFSEADAAKRIYDAAKPLRAAGIGIEQALDAVAAELASLAQVPTAKGELSRAVGDRMPAPYLRDCRACGAVHLHEMPFRLAALRAGLELVPGTSPPVLRPVPGLAPAEVVPERLDVVRCFLHLWGPATPQQVAGHLDAPVADVRARWPGDTVEVTVDGQRRSLLADDLDALAAGPVQGAWLLGPFDPYLQARDRPTLVTDSALARALWPVLGRPGAVVVDGDVVGTWRARQAGGLRVSLELRHALRPDARGDLEQQAQRLADSRRSTLAQVEVSG